MGHGLRCISYLQIKMGPHLQPNLRIFSPIDIGRIPKPNLEFWIRQPKILICLLRHYIFKKKIQITLKQGNLESWIDCCQAYIAVSRWIVAIIKSDLARREVLIWQNRYWQDGEKPMFFHSFWARWRKRPLQKNVGFSPSCKISIMPNRNFPSLQISSKRSEHIDFLFFFFRFVLFERSIYTLQSTIVSVYLFL